MRFGIVLIVAGVALFFATTPSSTWLTRGETRSSETGTSIDGRQVEGSKTTTQDYDLSSINTLQLETYAGEIDIEVGEDMSSQGTVTLQAVGMQTLPAVMRDGATLQIKATTQPCPTCLLHYRIKLGKAMNLVLKSANGMVTVDGLTNSLRLKHQNGEVKLRNLGKTTVQIENQNGGVLLENAELETESQNQVQNQNGEIVFDGVAFGAASQNRIQSSNGEVLVAVVPDQNGINIQTSAQNGEVTNEISGSVGTNAARLEVITFNGDINLSEAR